MFWIPLLALLAAMTSDAEGEVATQHGPPQDKTIFDLVSEGQQARLFGPIVQQLAMMIRSGQVTSYQDAAFVLARMGLGDPSSREFSKMGNLLYCLAKAEGNRTIWILDDEAYLALANTNPPWELARDRLPRLPFPAMLIRLPEPVPVVTEDIPYPVDIGSILLVEEVPGKRWRYIGINTARKMEKVIYTNGWFDVSKASAKSQLVEGLGVPDDADYRLTGEDVIWQLMLNLMLAMEHKHLEGKHVKPRVTKQSAKKLKKQKSAQPYTIVRLSSSTREAQAEQQRKADQTPQGRKPQKRHLRKGHWKRQWVLEPGDAPIYGTKPRFNREGELMDGLLYMTVIWVFPYWAGVGEPDPRIYKVTR